MKAACGGSYFRLPRPTYTGNRPTGRACSKTLARVASTCPPTRSNASATGWTLGPDSSTRAVSASPPRSTPYSVPLWRRQIRTRSFSPVDCRSRPIPWLADHKVHGTVLVPGAAMVEMALHAGDCAGCPRVDQLVLQAPLVVGEHGGVAVQVVVGEWTESGERPVGIYSRIDDGVDRRWTRHAEGVLCPAADAHRPGGDRTNGHRPARNAIDVSEAYPRAGRARIRIRSAFRGLRSVWRHGGEVFVEAVLPEQMQRADASRFGLHPALLDAVLHGIGAGGVLAESELTRLPFEWQGVSLDAVGATPASGTDQRSSGRPVAITLMDSRGGSIGRIDSLALRGVSPSRCG